MEIPGRRVTSCGIYFLMALLIDFYCGQWVIALLYQEGTTKNIIGNNLETRRKKIIFIWVHVRAPIPPIASSLWIQPWRSRQYSTSKIHFFTFFFLKSFIFSVILPKKRNVLIGRTPFRWGDQGMGAQNNVLHCGMYCRKWQKKERGVRISKNLFNSLSTVFCHSLHVQVFLIFPRKMQPYFQSDRKQKNSIHKTKMYLQQKKWETKQLVKKNTIKR